MQLEPTPNLVKEFKDKWRTWLDNVRKFLNLHTGGETPVSPATGSSWNAHGNTATGNSTNPLKIDAGTFWVEGSTGNTPSALATANRSFAWIPSLGALRAGTTTGTQWATIGADSVAIGNNSSATQQYSIAIGNSCTASGFVGAVAIGSTCTASGLASTAIGINCQASGLSFPVAIGTNALASANGGVAIGNAAQATTGNNAVAIGVQNLASGATSFSLGTWVDATAANSFVLGQGVNVGSRLVNNIASSMMIGVGATTPTLTLRNSRCGVGPTGTNPLSTIDVLGSVGAKATNLPATTEVSKTVGASDDEYTFRIDLSNLSSGTTYTLTLPSLATIDRRVYYIKATDINGPTGGGVIVRVLTNAADQIEGPNGIPFSAATSSTTGLTLPPGSALLIFGNTTDGVWWIQ